MSPVVLDALAEGWAQIALALFTTFTSSGIVGYVICAIYLLTRSDDDARMRIGRFLIIPLGAVIFGLIASTNHLGRPSNTLYVLSGIGRSPLSNEVVAVVVFTGLAWIAWLTSFGHRRGRTIMKVMLVVSLPAAVASLVFMANAYSIDTIITWSLPSAQMGLRLAGLTGGPMLALCALVAGGEDRPRLFLGLIIACTIAAIIGSLVQMMQYLALDSVESGLLRASELVPFYPACIVVSLALTLGSQVIGIMRLHAHEPLKVPTAALMTTMVLAGILLVRFCFYCTHLTAGI